ATRNRAAEGRATRNRAAEDRVAQDRAAEDRAVQDQAADGRGLEDRATESRLPRRATRAAGPPEPRNAGDDHGEAAPSGPAQTGGERDGRVDTAERGERAERGGNDRSTGDRGGRGDRGAGDRGAGDRGAGDRNQRGGYNQHDDGDDEGDGGRRGR